MTGISATLSTTTPGILVTNAASTYPDLVVGAPAAGNSPFGFFVDPAMPCGTAISFRLDMTANEGAWHDTFTMLVGSPSAQVSTYNATDVPRSIPDDGTVLSTLVVADSAQLGDVNTKVHITHPYDGDLILTLVGPGGTRVMLANRRGVGGSDFHNTIFDDEAATSISDGVPRSPGRSVRSGRSRRSTGSPRRTPGGSKCGTPRRATSERSIRGR